MSSCANDLTGKTFGNWKVIEYAENNKWLCECQCENHTRKLVAQSSLLSGASKSCGCLRKKILSELKRNKLEGKKFGYLEAISYSGNSMWKCKCNCGCNSFVEVRAESLINGATKSCGATTTKFKDLTGKQFGKWKVIEYSGDRSWLCECQCENHTRRVVSTSNLVSGASQSCGCSKKMHNIIDITGQKFGELTPIKYISDTNWLCRCSCGNLTIKSSQHIRRSTTISCGCKENKPLSKEYILNAIDEFEKDNLRSPFRNELRDKLDIGATTLARYIEKYDLYEFINKSFRSSYERDICELIDNNGFSTICNCRSLLKDKELDIYVPEKKLAIEVNGSYWHSTIFKDKKYHQEKTLACAKKGIHLIHVFEYELTNEKTKNKIYNLILSRLNDKNKTIIHGRKTTIKLINDTEIIRDFLEAYHLQGYIASKINIGCFFDDELIGLMTIGSPRFDSKYEYEIHRLCWKNNIIVTGGTQKLFKYFINNFDVNNIVTYCDISKFKGNCYTNIGFTVNSITSPNYVWVKTSDNIVLSRYQTQKHKLVELGLGKENQTEDEIMLANGFYKIYDSGNLKLEWYKQ